MTPETATVVAAITLAWAVVVACGYIAMRPAMALHTRIALWAFAVLIAVPTVLLTALAGAEFIAMP